jgi:glycosyltransferase involved in cell wall biosynthesis
MVPIETPLVSIVVPVYITSQAQAALLAETLDTVEQQTYREYEVLLVDDGSPLEIERFARRSCVSVIRRENGGSALARNTGIAASRGEFLVFLDGDDHLLPQALECGVTHLRQHPECGFAVGPREEMAFDGAPVSWQVPPPPALSRLYNTLLGFDWYIIPPSSAMFRRSVVEHVGGFQNPWGADDLDFYLRVTRRYAAYCYASPAVTRYRRYSSSSSRDGARMLRSMREVYARQREVVQGDPEGEAAFARGQAQLTDIFLNCLVENVDDAIRAHHWTRAWRAARLLAAENPAKLAALARQLRFRRRSTALS